VSFCPFGSEPQINIEKEGMGEAYRVAYVRIEDWSDRSMDARVARRDTPDLWEEFEVPQGERIFQPRGDLPKVDSSEIAVILVPGLAFSSDGSRLGRGAGFYDRFLCAHPSALRVGVAWGEQILPEIPVSGHDERVDIILTEQSLVTTNSYGEWRIHGKIKSRNQP